MMHLPFAASSRLPTELRISLDIWRTIGPVARLRWRLCDGLDWLRVPAGVVERVFPLVVVEREQARHEAHYQDLVAVARVRDAGISSDEVFDTLARGILNQQACLNNSLVLLGIWMEAANRAYGDLTTLQRVRIRLDRALHRRHLHVPGLYPRRRMAELQEYHRWGMMAERGIVNAVSKDDAYAAYAAALGVPQLDEAQKRAALLAAVMEQYSGELDQ